ncbi:MULTISPECIES: hypothetical protein [Moorena]|nr:MULTISPECIES: hypothetical protein [Moorena]NEP30574.1 hypothetical protein [Moorena sp. SIO3B2]NEP65253.1 hypothetical protein [Moorena sp. SIO3A5]NER87254.1 hypothetical protein [Moorena sp. SIO3A2]NES45256.1 hypothetical protein [Moorena sp. SIO2C4]
MVYGKPHLAPTSLRLMSVKTYCTAKATVFGDEAKVCGHGAGSNGRTMKANVAVQHFSVSPAMFAEAALIFTKLSSKSTIFN